MKRFNDLTAEQQAKAIEKRTCCLLEIASEGFSIEGLEKQIADAWKEANRMQTPWFFHEYLMDSAGDLIHQYATSEAQQAFYPEPGELVVRI